MLKSCQYCGRIHEKRYDCGMKPKRNKEVTDADKFRWTKGWKHKREEIRGRDNNVCQVCARGLYGTDKRYNYTNLSVHHAIPIVEDWDKRLDNDNLITLCDTHHEMAEQGVIPRIIIIDIINEQEINKEGMN